MKQILILLLGFVLLNALAAQVPPFHFIHHSTPDGLSSNDFVKGGAMTQDKTGYLWIGTANGLNRFDGTTFVQFIEDRADSNSLKGKVIRSLYTDHLGFVWVGTYRNGLNVIDPGSGKIRHFVSDGQDTIPFGNITTIFEDKWQRLWIAQAGIGLYLYDRDNDNFQEVALMRDKNILNANNGFHHEVTGFVFDPNDSTYIWLSTVGGICKFNSSTFDAQYYNTETINFGGRNLHSDGKGNLWFGTWGRGLFKFEISAGTFTKYRCNDPKISADGSVWALDITSLEDGKLLIATVDLGLVIFDPEGESFSLLDSVQYQDGAPRHASMFFRDQNDNLWITSNGEGIYCLQPQRQLYNKIPLKGNIFRVLQNPVTKDIYACSNDRAGLYKINSKTFETTVIRVHPREDMNVSGFTGISFDRHGRTWILEWYDLYKLDKSESYVSPVEWRGWKTAMKRFGYFWSMAMDKEDHLWITAQSGGLGELDIENELLTIHGFVADNPRSMHQNYSVSEAMVDQNQRIWTCSSRGFSYYSQLTNDFENYPSPTLTSDKGIGFDRICAIAEGEDETIWLAEDLNRLGFIHARNPVNTPVQIVEATTHLPRAEVHAMVYDSNRTLWIGSTIGITRLDHPYDRAVHYGSTFGIGAIEDLNLTADGRLIAGLYGEMLIIDPKRLKYFDVSPKPVLTAFKVFDKRYSEIANPNFLEDVQLSYKQNFFSFEYSAIDFTSEEEAEFSYMLEGLEDDWVNAGSRQFVSYTNIGGGDYVFKVRVKNAIGQWSDETAELKITVIPPLTGRIWFWPLLILLGVLIVYVLYRMRIRQIRHEEQLKTAFNKQLAEVEMKALRAQMNPHFLFNSLNAIKYYVLKKDRHMAADYLTDFSKLIRLVLKNSSEKLIPLKREMDALKLYVQIESLRFDKIFEYHVKIDEKIDQESVMVPPLIFQPYVENAIWHGLMHKIDGDGILKIDLMQKNGMIQCKIEDNGIGREKAERVKSKSAEQRKSMGMQITRHRMDMSKILNDIEFTVDIEDIYSKLGDPGGTRVMISFQPKPINAITS